MIEVAEILMNGQGPRAGACALERALLAEQAGDADTPKDVRFWLEIYGVIVGLRGG